MKKNKFKLYASFDSLIPAKFLYDAFKGFGEVKLTKKSTKSRKSGKLFSVWVKLTR